MENDFAILNSSRWFQEQLRASGYGFVWAMKQVATERHDQLPPQQLGEWTAKRHAFHLLYHEENIALPRIKQWLGGKSPSVDRNAEEKAWCDVQEGIESLLDRFLGLRLEQIKLALQFSDEAWMQTREVQGWGPGNLHWVYSKN